MQNNQFVTGISFLLYIAAMIFIGFIAYRRTRDLSDYILGGRRMGNWVTALSAGASDMSGWLLLGLPGYAYVAGFEAVWIALGLLIGTYLNWKILAQRLRRYSEYAADSLTLPDYLENRFEDDSHILRIVAAFFIVLFFLFYTSSGLVAGGKLFNAVFDLPYHWAVIAGALTILIYTFIGGFLAVSWTDLIQGLLMALVLLIVPLSVLLQQGGWSVTEQAMHLKNPALTNILNKPNGQALGVIGIVSLLAWGLGYFGQPHILARFKAIHSDTGIPAARRIATSWTLITLTGALLVGYTGIGYLSEPLQDKQTEQVFIIMVNLLFNPFIAGICLAAILAAIMSTADSQLLVSASVLSKDFYKTLLRKQASDRELLWSGRIAVVIITMCALYLAWEPGRKVLDMVAYAWAGFGAAFGPVMIASLYWRSMNRCTALAGMLGGGITVVVWKQLSGGIFDIYEIVPGFLISFVSMLIVSYLSKPANESLQQKFTYGIRHTSTRKDTV